jgi:integrase/recombinase XerC/integrase/recombinase XerD
MEEKANSLVIAPTQQFEIAILDVEGLVAEWLNLDVANGDACSDTLKTYRWIFEAWLIWCSENQVHPGQATVEDVKEWRQDLVAAGSKPSTIALKLTTIRRFYQSAVDRRLLKSNPAANVRAPKERRAVKEQIKYLSAGEAELLFRAVPKDSKIKSLRDRAMIGLMALEGLRRVEIVRACVSDIGNDLDGIRLLVHGKGKERFIYPREDTAQTLQDYLTLRGPLEKDDQGEPLFVQIRKGGIAIDRISRTGVNKVVDYYLLKAGLKRQGLSCHALRHTCGALLYQATRDVRAVQETLGHSNIATSAGYAHIIDRGKARYTKEIPVKIG